MPLSVEDGKRLIELEAHIKRLEQGAQTAPPTPAVPPDPATAAAPQATPSPWQALRGAFAGTQRLPFQAGAPAEATDPSQLVVEAEKQYVPAPVRGAIETIAGPSNVLEGVATALVPGPLKPFAGAAAAGAGEGIRQYEAGEPMDWRKIASEAGWSLAPELAESMGRWGVRQFARNSPGGISLRTDQAAREARAAPEKIFQPKPADQISDAFEQVRRTNLPIDTGDIRTHLTTLSPGKQADVHNLLVGLDRSNMTGGRYTQLYQDAMSGKNISSSIGDLQDLRSKLRKHVEGMEPNAGEARQMVRDLQRSVDDAIDFGLTQGAMASSSTQIRDMLHGARRDWAHRAAADDLGDLIEGKISSSPNLESSVFSLRNLADEMRRGRTEASKSVNRSLDMTPGARDKFNQELHEISRLYDRISIPMTDVQGIYRMPMIAGARQAIGQLLLTDAGRKAFEKAVIDGRGTLSPNALAALTNAALRETDPQWRKGTSPTHAPWQQETPSAPGGVARRTD